MRPHSSVIFFFLNDTAPTDIYPLPLHAAFPIFYYKKTKRALVELYNRRSSIGLVGSGINVKTGAWTDSTSHIGGGIDSYYEYLLKSWLLFEIGRAHV